MGILLLTLVITVLQFIGSNAVPKTIVPGVDWYDISGNLIEAHGGSVIKVGETYYWFGEDRSEKTTAWVNVYSSSDLVTWTFKNHALARTSSGDLGSGRMIAQPKITYDESSKKYIMYFRIDNVTNRESLGLGVGVASSSSVDGVYTYESKTSIDMIGEFTAFRDTDGQTYIIYSTYNYTKNMHSPLRITKLSPNQNNKTDEVFHFTAGNETTAPVVIKVANTYYLIASTDINWGENVQYATASSMSGPWSKWTALTSDITTFQTDSAFVITVQGSTTTSYIFAGDRWQDNNCVYNRYVWLPLTISGNKMSMTWQDYWTIDTETGVHINEPVDNGTEYLAESDKNTMHGLTHVITNFRSALYGTVNYVSHIGKSPDNYLQFNGVTATSDGVHTLKVYYLLDENTYRTGFISVNNGTGVAHRFPTTVLEIRMISFEIMLKKGNNTIKIYNDDVWSFAPDIYKITVSK